MTTGRAWALMCAGEFSLCLGIGAACLLFSPHLSAQAADSSEQLTTDPASDVAQESRPAVAPLPVIEEVYITGSLLPRGNYTSNAPITTVDSEQFEITSTVNLESLLNTMPQILAGSDRTSTFGFGWATADLRGLGENRTLTLLDGKRIVPSFADGGTVDLNLIPPGIIERVEVLTGGASTTYGSDAMAGVINLITKSDFEGLELAGAGESTEYGDAGIYNVAGTWGKYFGGDRGHVMVHVDLSRRQSLDYSDREFAKNFNTDTYDGEGRPIGFENFRFQTSTSGNLVFFGFGQDYRFTETGNLLPFNRAEHGSNPAEALMLQLPQEREVVFGKTYWQGDNFELRGQIHLANSLLERSQGPVTFSWSDFRGPVGITLEGNPFLSPAAIQVLGSNPVVRNFGLDFDGNGIPNIANVFLGRTLTELGPTKWDQDYSLQQFEFGLTYELSDMWSFDAFANFGEIELDWLADPVLDAARLRQSLVVNTFDRSGQTCLNPANGCVPLNVYGSDNMAPEAIEFIRTQLDSQNSSTILTVNAVITGNTSDFFEMPGGAGPLGVALGIEYLERSQDWSIDERVENNELLYVGFFPTAIDRELSRKSGFLELVVPLLQDLPFVSFMELELAARYTDHETIGGTTSWKAALSWYPLEDLQFRTSLNQAVRAPSINDLYLNFGNQDVLAPPSFFDPCAGVIFDGSAALEARCIATGVPAEAVGSQEIRVSPQGIVGYYGGNADIREETGNTLSVGLVWTPYSIEGLSASIDYFSIEIEDYIGRLPGNAREQVQECYFPNDPATELSGFCSSVERNDGGAITRVNAGLKNIATHSIKGFDLSISKTSDFLGGVLDATYVASFINSKEFSVTGTNLAEDCAGKFNVTLGGNACSRPVTDLKHRATLGWARSQYSMQLTWTHLSSVDDGDEEQLYFVEHIPAYDSVDLAMAYDFYSGFKLVGGIRNLFDTAPTILGDNSFEANTYPNLYDVFGRTFYLRASHQF